MGEDLRGLSQRQHMGQEARECYWLLNKQASQECPHPCCVISTLLLQSAAPLSWSWAASTPGADARSQDSQDLTRDSAPGQ